MHGSIKYKLSTRWGQARSMMKAMRPINQKKGNKQVRMVAGGVFPGALCGAVGVVVGVGALAGRPPLATRAGRHREICLWAGVASCLPLPYWCLREGHLSRRLPLLRVPWYPGWGGARLRGVGRIELEFCGVGRASEEQEWHERRKLSRCRNGRALAILLRYRRSIPHLLVSGVGCREGERVGQKK